MKYKEVKRRGSSPADILKFIYSLNVYDASGTHYMTS